MEPRPKTRDGDLAQTAQKGWNEKWRGNQEQLNQSNGFYLFSFYEVVFGQVIHDLSDFLPFNIFTLARFLLSFALHDSVRVKSLGH